MGAVTSANVPGHSEGVLTFLFLALGIPGGFVGASGVLLQQFPRDTGTRWKAGLITALVTALAAFPVGFMAAFFLIGDGHGWPYETQMAGALTFGVPIATLVGGLCLAFASRPRSKGGPRAGPTRPRA